jgi:hypothetical protein
MVWKRFRYFGKKILIFFGGGGGIRDFNRAEVYHIIGKKRSSIPKVNNYGEGEGLPKK